MHKALDYTMSMKDRTGCFDIRIGDHVNTDRRPYPVIALEILEEEGVIRFIDDEGAEDFGRPGLYRGQYEVLNARQESSHPYKYNVTIMKLADYINKYFGGCQADFARAQHVQPSQITQWLKKDFIVVDHRLYSFRRDLKRPE